MVRKNLVRLASALLWAALCAAPVFPAPAGAQTAPAPPVAAPEPPKPATETPKPAEAPKAPAAPKPELAAPGAPAVPGKPAEGAPPADPNAPQQETPTVAPIQLPERPALVIRGKSSWDDGFKSITGAFTRMRAEIDRSKLKIAGHPLAVFVESDDDGFTYEAMIPLDSEPPASLQLPEGIKAGKNPGGKALKFEHRGSYDEIETTYEAIAAYLDEKGLSARDELIEEFINETIGSDDRTLMVDIYVLLKE